jgi:hypothetical protein
MGSKPKRHHFVPRFYLEGFARDGKLWLYDRERKQFRHGAPDKIAIICDYYTLTNEQGEKDCRIEEFLSVIEGKAKTVILKLEARGNISPEERLSLAHFIALLAVRIPRFDRDADEIADAACTHLIKHAVPTLAAAAELLKQHREGNKPADITPESMFDFIHKEKFSVKMKRNFAIDSMLGLALKSTLEVAMMDWLVVHANTQTSFITSDNPVGYIVPPELARAGEPVFGICSQKVTKIVPLSQRVALLMGKFGGGLGHASFDRDHVRDLNVTTAEQSHAYVYARDESLLRSIVRHTKIDTASHEIRMKVEHIPHPSDPNRTYLVTRLVHPESSDKPLNLTFKDGKPVFP